MLRRCVVCMRKAGSAAAGTVCEPCPALLLLQVAARPAGPADRWRAVLGCSLHGGRPGAPHAPPPALPPPAAPPAPLLPRRHAAAAGPGPLPHLPEQNEGKLKAAVCRMFGCIKGQRSCGSCCSPLPAARPLSLPHHLPHRLPHCPASAAGRQAAALLPCGACLLPVRLAPAEQRRQLPAVPGQPGTAAATAAAAASTAPVAAAPGQRCAGPGICPHWAGGHCAAQRGAAAAAALKAGAPAITPRLERQLAWQLWWPLDTHPAALPGRASRLRRTACSPAWQLSISAPGRQQQGGCPNSLHHPPSSPPSGPGPGPGRC
jgi:hypothetical protein